MSVPNMDCALTKHCLYGPEQSMILSKLFASQLQVLGRRTCNGGMTWSPANCLKAIFGAFDIDKHIWRSPATMCGELGSVTHHGVEISRSENASF